VGRGRGGAEGPGGGLCPGRRRPISVQEGEEQSSATCHRETEEPSSGKGRRSRGPRGRLASELRPANRETGLTDGVRQGDPPRVVPRLLITSLKAGSPQELSWELSWELRCPRRLGRKTHRGSRPCAACESSSDRHLRPQSTYEPPSGSPFLGTLSELCFSASLWPNLVLCFSAPPALDLNEAGRPAGVETREEPSASSAKRRTPKMKPGRAARAARPGMGFDPISDRRGRTSAHRGSPALPESPRPGPEPSRARACPARSGRPGAPSPPAARCAP